MITSNVCQRARVDARRPGAPLMKRLPSNDKRSTGIRRRGVASVLAMMFLVLFGSLAAAMAVVAQTTAPVACSTPTD